MPPDLTDSGPTGAARLLVLGPAELVGPAGQPAPAAALQSKRLLLLTYLALEGSRAPVRRDKLLALFWPELDDERARHALRQAVHQLRASLPEGSIVSRGEAALTIDPARLWCDAVMLLEEGEQLGQGVAELYRGDLLDGVHAGGTSPELEQWLDQARGELRVRAAAIGWAAAARAEEAGDASGAIVLATWAGEQDPEDERAARRQMRLLVRHGDRAGALRLYEALAAHLSRELDAEPDPETQALADEIRRAEYQRTSPPHAPASTGADPGAWNGLERRTDAAPPDPPSPRQRWPLLLGLLVVATSIGVALGWRDRATAVEDWPIVAVGHIEVVHRPGGDSLLDPATVSGVLATDLARIVGVHTLSQARVYEFQPRGGGLSAAARRAGADDLIEGRLVEQAGGRLRLELRRVDARRGVIRDSFTADGANLFDVVSAATARVADLYNAAVPSVPIGLLTSRSLAAQRRFQEGLRALGQYDFTAARAAFFAALEQDSTFTAAAYHASGLSGADSRRLGELVERAAAAADSAPDRERLQIRFLWADLTHDPLMVTYAESLATRFPAEPEGHIALARALLGAGDFGGAVREARRALAIDSALGTPHPMGSGGCRRCEMLQFLVSAYQLLDSMDAAEREARALMAASDSGPIATHYLASALSQLGRHEEARHLVESVWNRLPRSYTWAQAAAEMAVRAGEFDRADSLLRIPGPSAAWDRAILLRTRGRYREALRLTEDEFCSQPQSVSGWASSTASGHRDLCDLSRALGHAGLGDPARTARILDSAVHRPVTDGNQGRGLRARRQAWFLALEGVAWADAGDTAELARTADSSQAYGRLSSYGRDRRIHHHLRGLLALARGDTAGADAAFRASIWSLSMGYGRTNLALADLLLHTGRPEEAYAIVEPASRGQMSAMGSHTTFTDMHAMAARASHEAGWADRAAFHAEWALAAWQDADPNVLRRRDSLRAYLRPNPRAPRP